MNKYGITMFQRVSLKVLADVQKGCIQNVTGLKLYGIRKGGSHVL